MRLSALLTGYAVASLLPTAFAWPGMSNTLSDLNHRLRERADAPEGPEDSSEMIGDLATVGAVTPTGQSVKNILLGAEDPYSDVAWSGNIPGKNTAKCAADTCCIWTYIVKEMEAKFRGNSGRCNGNARAAVRLGFHDAGTWSKNTADYGGADGSIILANELGRPENNGLQKIGGIVQKWYDQYSKFGVTMADIIQVGASVATVVCPLGPRMRTFVGRKDSSKPAVDGLLPDVFADANSLIKLFEAKTIRAHGLAALVGAHTTSQQRFVNTSRALDPQDSTPGVWDVLFYGQTINQPKPPKRVFKFPSDVKLAAHPKVSDEWKSFAGQGGQDHWNEDFSKEYLRLSLLGVNNINNMTECTKVLPAAIKSFSNPDQAQLDKWLDGGLNGLGQTVEDGTKVTVEVIGSLTTELVITARKLVRRFMA